MCYEAPNRVLFQIELPENKVDSAVDFPDASSITQRHDCQLPQHVWDA